MIFSPLKNDLFRTIRLIMKLFWFLENCPVKPEVYVLAKTSFSL